MNERILEQTVVSAGPLQSLTPEELRLDSELAVVALVAGRMRHVETRQPLDT